MRGAKKTMGKKMGGMKKKMKDRKKMAMMERLKMLRAKKGK